MRLYVESSAVVAWLLDEGTGPRVEDALAAAELVIASALTIAETRRVLVRAVADGLITSPDAEASRQHLARVSDYWLQLRLHASVLDRASRPFPHEPVRTLDALHLASVLEASDAVAGLTVLTLDRRIRANARALGFAVLPVDD